MDQPIGKSSAFKIFNNWSFELDLGISELATKKNIRGGHRGHAVKLVSAAHELVEGYDGQSKTAIQQMRVSLSEKNGSVANVGQRDTRHNMSWRIQSRGSHGRY